MLSAAAFDGLACLWGLIGVCGCVCIYVIYVCEWSGGENAAVGRRRDAHGLRRCHGWCLLCLNGGEGQCGTVACVPV